tara:strand:- start:229 stop:798 length:570 start_codon:yes stop_codon:yes gene_type:complete
MFIHISTDEVYGDTESGRFFENSVLNPSNPYSASKAAAEMFVLSHSRTYGIDYIITRSSNNYGPRQYEEKLIPNTLSCLKDGRKVPIHGDGLYVRDWLYVKDNIAGIFAVIDSGVKNETFNIASNNEMTNLDVIGTISKWFGITDPKECIKFVPNRLGQDVRYSLSTEKIRKLGWKPTHETGLYKFTNE